MGLGRRNFIVPKGLLLPDEGKNSMPLKALVAAVSALAIAIGFTLPGRLGDQAEARSQIPMLELG